MCLQPGEGLSGGPCIGVFSVIVKNLLKPSFDIPHTNQLLVSCDLVLASSLCYSLGLRWWSWWRIILLTLKMKHWHKLEQRTEKGKTLIANLSGGEICRWGEFQVCWGKILSSLLRLDTEPIYFLWHRGHAVNRLGPGSAEYKLQRTLMVWCRRCCEC